jgi:hypothetical protein
VTRSLKAERPSPVRVPTRHPVYLDDWALLRLEVLAARRASERMQVVRHQPAEPVALAR